MPTNPILVFGYGNPSRGDDALGPLLLQRLATDNWPGLETLTDFQLQVEHALDLQGREVVLFVDASLSHAAPFVFSELAARQDRSYSSHALSPEALLAAFQTLYQRQAPPCFLLAIKGESFNLGEELSPAAQRHLDAAAAFVMRLLASPTPPDWRQQVADLG